VTAVGRDAPLLSLLLVLAVFALFGNAGVEVGIPALAHQRLHGAIALGLLFGAWGLGSVACGMLPRPRRVGALIMGNAAVVGAGIAVAAVTANLALLLAAVAICGIAGGILTTYAMSAVQGRTDPAVLGRVMSLVMFAVSGTEPIGLAMAGGVAQRGLDVLFWLCAIAIVASALGALLVPSVRRM
jgi:hypothetical protein